MSKELETIQSALNKLDLLIDDDKRCECINDKVHKYIDIIQNQIDKLENDIERNKKLEKVWKIVKDKPLSELHKSLIISCENYEQYKKEWEFSFKRFCREVNPQFYTELEFILLKEMLEDSNF